MSAKLPGDAVDAAILFLDVQHYSKLKGVNLSCFHMELIPDLASTLFEDGLPPWILYSNTWGDGLVVISQDYIKLSQLALKINDYFNHEEYGEPTNYRLKEYKLAARIAIHAGVFYSCIDPFKGTKGYFGDALIVAARIEPVTPPHHVWVTEEAKQRIAKHYESLDIRPSIRFDKRGPVDLAKAFGTESVWDLCHFDTDTSKRQEGTEIETSPDDARSDTQGDEDSDRNARIRAIFGQAMDVDALGECETKPSEPCQLPFSSLSVAAELIRNTEVASMTSHCVRVFRKVSDQMRDVQAVVEGDQSSGDVHRRAMILRRGLQELKAPFSRGGRGDDKTEDSEAWHRLECYLSHRIAVESQIPIVDILTNVESTVSDLIYARPAERKRMAKSKEFMKDLDTLAETFGNAELHLGSLPDVRCKGILDAVEATFKPDVPALTSEALEALFRVLPHNVGQWVPRIWRVQT